MNPNSQGKKNNIIDSNSTNPFENQDPFENTSFPTYMQNTMEFQPQRHASSQKFDAAIAESYNGGNGFTPFVGSTRGSSSLFHNTPSSPHMSSGTNGGDAAGRSCLVIPNFGSGKKKKKAKNTRSPGNKRNGGGLFGRSSSSAASTSAESSVADPFFDHHNDQQSLLKSYGKKVAGNSTRDWYMETMIEEEEDDETNNKSASNHIPLQFEAVREQQPTTEPYSQFRQPRRETNPFASTNNDGQSASSNEAIPNLLQLPKAQNRSHQERARRNKMHAYEGELEPEGVRGQEATVVTKTTESNSRSTHSSPQVAMRDFSNSYTSDSSSQLLPMRQMVSNSKKHSPLLHPDQSTEYDDENDHLKHLDEQSPLKPPPGHREEERLTLVSAASSTSNLARDLRREDYRKHDDKSTSARSRIVETEKQRGRELQAIFSDDPDRQSPTVPRNPNLVSTENTSPASSPSRSQRRSAPVNIDDASFEDPLDHIQGINAMAMEHVMQGEYDMALQAFKQVLQVYIQEHGEAHPLTASAHHNIGTVHTKRAGLLPDHTLHQRHCREQALRCFQAAARSARDCPTLGPNHPNVAVSLVRIGFLLLQSRQYQNAVITFEEALRIRTENYGPTHGLVANLYNNLGVCHMHLQNFKDGRNYLQQALDIQKELLGQQQNDDDSTALLELADTLCNIGGLNLEWIRRQGPDARRALDAESSFLEALELRSRVLGEDHALTNQVRSLHDMVRSIPMPKSVDTPANGTSPRPSFATSVQSSVAGNMTPNGSDLSPAAVSEMTEATHPIKHLTNQKTSPLSTPEKVNSSSLSLPLLKMPANESLVAGNDASKLSFQNVQAHTNSTYTDGYDALEESCLLRRPTEDDQSASQAGGFVSYAQTTVSTGSGVDSNTYGSDRASTMRHAKNVLDSHRDFMDSPFQKDGRMDSLASNTNVNENSNEDGLVPLAGNWPGPRNVHRLSPNCLENPTANLHTIHNCAASYMANGRFMEAVTLLDMVVDCQKTRYGDIHAHVGSAVHNVGVAYLRTEQHYDAFQSFEEAVRIRKAALGRDHPDVAVSLVKFGISLMLLQRHEDSLWIFRDALSIRKQALGEKHPSNARIWNNIGCVHVELNELTEAKRAFESALDIQRNALVRNPDNGPMIFGASTTLQNLGYLYGKWEMYEKAAMVLRESLSLQERIMFPEHPTVLVTLESLAETCLDARRYTHALKYFRQLFERSQGIEPVDCLKQAGTLEIIATIYGRLDDHKAQNQKLEMALRFLRSDNSSGGRAEQREALERKIRGTIDQLRKESQRSKAYNNWV